jgi:hypothetical protein
MKTCRNGVHMVEICVGFGLVGGVLLIIMTLMHHNSRATRRSVAHTTARLVLADLAELLMGETMEELVQIEEGGPEQLDRMINGRIAAMPEAAQRLFRTEISPFLGRFSLQVEPSCVDAEQLARITLKVKLDGKDSVGMVRLFRPDSRIGPPVRGLGHEWVSKEN